MNEVLIKGGRSKINEMGEFSDDKVMNEIRGVMNSLILTM